VISGWAGHGKTSLLMRMLANLMERGVNVALGSFETMPRPILERRLRACLYRCGELGPKANSPGPADEILAKRLSVIAHTARDEDTELDLEYILELAKVAVLRDGVRLLVLDPWNEIEHKRGRDETETEYVCPGDPIAEAVRAQLRMRRVAGGAPEEAAQRRQSETAEPLRSRRLSALREQGRLRPHHPPRRSSGNADRSAGCEGPHGPARKAWASIPELGAIAERLPPTAFWGGKLMFRYLGHSIVSGVVGWGVLMLAFEGVFLAECYIARKRRYHMLASAAENTS
jgi:hypothetical protein